MQGITDLWLNGIWLFLSQNKEALKSYDMSHNVKAAGYCEETEVQSLEGRWRETQLSRPRLQTRLQIMAAWTVIIAEWWEVVIFWVNLIDRTSWTSLSVVQQERKAASCLWNPSHKHQEELNYLNRNRETERDTDMGEEDYKLFCTCYIWGIY